jgi:hypothetical protein
MARKYKYKPRQCPEMDHDKPRMLPLTEAKKAKAFRDCQRGERESTCQLSTSNAATAANSLIELHSKMWSADTDMYVDKPTGLVGVQLRAPDVWSPNV